MDPSIQDEGKLPNYESEMRILRNERRLFIEKVYRIGFEDDLLDFSNETGIEYKTYTVGYAAASNTVPAHYYLHVMCQNALPSGFSGADGWGKTENQDILAYTSLSATNEEDSKPIEVFLETRGQIALEAIVGNCVSTQIGFLTQGLVIESNDASRWSLTVGHMFNQLLPLAPENTITFCPPSAPPDPAAPIASPECQFCLSGQCSTLCAVIPKDKRILVALGAVQIFTLNPRTPNTDTLDFGAYQIPDLGVVGLTALKVSSVLSDSYTKNSLQGISEYAFQEIAGAKPGIEDVADLVVFLKLAEVLVKWRTNGVFIFKKGITTGWTFAQITRFHKKAIFAKVLGKSTDKGDCGSIWFMANPYDRKAYPLGYHVGSFAGADGTKSAILTPYETVIDLLREREGFEGLQFMHLESYDW
ncbi:hypothetical protein TWF281_002264 [Arthrobotrys megalospora]